MELSNNNLDDEISLLYREPAIGANYSNTYGEQNITNLVTKYRSLTKGDMDFMLDRIVEFSRSTDLSSSFVSVGVLHALGKKEKVEEAYEWARQQEDGASFTSHFDIGISLADHFVTP